MGSHSSGRELDLFYSLDGGGAWTSIAKDVRNTIHPWSVPKTVGNKKACLVRVIGYNATRTKKIGFDTSDTPFTIEVVKLTSPNGGPPPLKQGGTIDITWTAYRVTQPITKVQLFYTKDGGVNWILITTLSGDYPPGDYSQPWTIPPVGTTPKTKCKVKVALKDANEKNLGSDLSDAYFTISNPTIGTDPIPPDHFLSGFGSSEVYRGQTFRLSSEHAARANKLRVFVGPTNDFGANFNVLLTEMDMTGGFHPTTVIFESKTLNVSGDRRGPDEFVVNLGGLLLQPGRDYAWILDHFVVGNEGAFVSMGTGTGSYSDGRAFRFINGPSFLTGTRQDHFATDNWFVSDDPDFAFQLEFTILP